MPAPHRPRLLILLAFFAFISLGLPDGILGVAWPAIRTAFHRPFDNLGLLLIAGTSAYLVSSFFAGQLLRTLGVARLLILSCSCVTAGLLGNALVPAFHWMPFCAVLGGLGAGAIDSGINAFAAERFSTRVVNWLHACWGIGATTGPALMTFILAAQLPWRIGYAAIAAAVALLTFLFILTRAQWSAHPAAPQPIAPISHALKHPAIWLHVLIFFVYCGIESSAGQLLFTLFTESRHIALPLAGAAITAYWAALTIGRILFGQLAASIPARTVLLAGTLLAPVASALILWNLHPALTLGGTALLGFALAPIFPTYIAITPARLGPALAPHAIGFQVAAASVGIMVFPTSIAALTRPLGLECIPLFLLIASVTLLALHLLAQLSASARPIRA